MGVASDGDVAIVLLFDHWVVVAVGVVRLQLCMFQLRV